MDSPRSVPEQFIVNEHGEIEGVKKYNSEFDLWIYLYFSKEINNEVENEILQSLTQVYTEKIQQLLEQIELTLD